MDYVTLKGGVKMPQLGYGVFQVPGKDCTRCVLDAISVGYRALDTGKSLFFDHYAPETVEMLTEMGKTRVV